MLLLRGGCACKIILLTVLLTFGLRLKAQTPLESFTNQANALLKAKFGFGVDAIPIYSTRGGRLYTDDIHQCLQTAADACVAGLTADAPPPAFRPRFASKSGTNYISGYAEVTDCAFLQNTWSPMSSVSLPPDANVYGIPVVVGAKSGIANFNEFSSVTQVEMLRKLQFCKTTPQSPVSQTNQMLVASITNASGVELWNCSTNAVDRNVRVYAENRMTFSLLNDWRGGTKSSCVATQMLDVPKGSWPGLTQTQGVKGFLTLLNTNVCPLPLSAYVDDDGVFRELTSSSPTNFVPVLGLPVYNWTLTTSNCLTYWMIDLDSQKLLDFVCLQFTNSVALTPCLLQSDPSSWDPTGATCWPGSPPSAGVSNQIQISLGTMPSRFWYSPWIQQEIADFNLYFNRDIGETNCGAPFCPTAFVCQKVALQTGDPLHHYNIRDLTCPSAHESIAVGGPFNPSAELTTYPCSLNGMNPAAVPVLSGANFDRTAAGGIRFHFAGYPFCIYYVASSSDLKFWSFDYWALESSPGNFEVDDPWPVDHCFFKVGVGY